jgi:hypothetical protein
MDSDQAESKQKGPTRPPQEELDKVIEAYISARADDGKGPTLWNLWNAIAFLLLIHLIAFIALFGMQQVDNYEKVRANWKEYRCQPMIMPFASAYGYNTADNFQFCLKNIFTGHAQELTAPFTSILGVFSQIIGKITTTITSIYTQIATMGGGLNTIFQDFTNRIMNFFFQLRLSAIRIKNMITRMHAIMFSMVYMGASGIKATTNFGNTALFSFLDTFCFPPETTLLVDGKGFIPIYQVQIGDILLPTRSRVSAKFHFAAQGQPMVELKDGIQVSTNHYLQWNGKWIAAKDHPDAIDRGPYTRQSLLCLNTEDNLIPMKSYIFRDYDETSGADTNTLAMIEQQLNGSAPTSSTITENSPSFHPDTSIKLADGTLCQAKDLRVSMKLATGSIITGLIHKEVQEVVYLTDKEIVGSATLVWAHNQWTRAGELYPLRRYKKPVVFIGLIVLTNSQIELASGTRVRDYLELCSPDAETFYADAMDAMVYSK